MKKKEKQELHQKSIAELRKILGEKSKELVKARVEKEQGKKKDVKIVAKIRDEIAVIKTIIREKELSGEK
ncbi:50S ribosomal protein L29 [bacterium]|nr:50S ribosomal protein L29 [bacterium]